MAIDAPRCQGLRVNTLKPCRTTKHLNAAGYCKYHDPDALQCRGTAKSTGVRCRIKWDLNGDQLCQFHTAQASYTQYPKDERGSAPAATAKPSVKREGGGTAKMKLTKYAETAPVKAKQCRGIAKKTGERCRIKWELNSNELCKYHAHLPPAFATCAGAASASSVGADAETSSPVKASSQQCRGIASSTNARCEIRWDLNKNQLCKYHFRQTPAFPAATAARAVTTKPAAMVRAPRVLAAARSCRGIARSTGRGCRIHWGLDAHGYCEWHGL